MRLALSGLLVLGLATLAGAQATGPTISVESQSMEKFADGVSRFRGWKLAIDGVEIRADEATTGKGGEITLQGNVTVALPKTVILRKTF